MIPPHRSVDWTWKADADALARQIIIVGTMTMTKMTKAVTIQRAKNSRVTDFEAFYNAPTEGAAQLMQKMPSVVSSQHEGHKVILHN